MQIFSAIETMKRFCKAQTSLAFVPTMGALHEGHLALVKEARRHADAVVVSIFVNPLQFGAQEDFGLYPRTLEEDVEKLAPFADAVFAPSHDVLYPKEQTVFIEPPKLADTLCGQFRPGHFKGVLTVVAKLFHIIEPNVALFGKKDYQQFVLVREMAHQLNMVAMVLGVATVREQDGLAMSSRNRYLSPEEREKAPRLYETLCKIAKAVEQGENDYSRLCQKAVDELSALGFVVDYVDIRQADDLAPIEEGARRFVVLGAATLGKTRLIDNIEGFRA